MYENTVDNVPVMSSETQIYLATRDQDPKVSWWERMSCAGEDPDIFVGPSNETKRDRSLREEAAKAICDSCPVKQQCLTWYLEKGDYVPFAGGLSGEQRSALKSRSKKTA